MIGFVAEEQWYPDEKFFEEYDEDDYVPPGVDRATYIDPDWCLFDKACKKMAPFDWQLAVSLLLLMYSYLFKKLYKWFHLYDDILESSSEEEDPVKREEKRQERRRYYAQTI